MNQVTSSADGLVISHKFAHKPDLSSRVHFLLTRLVKRPSLNKSSGGCRHFTFGFFLTDAQPRFCCLSAQKRKRDAEKKSRCRGCVRVRLFQTPQTTWGKRGQKFSRPWSLQNFTNFSANSSSLVSQLHPTCNKLIVQRADALTQQPHAFICRSTRTGTDFP